MSMNPAPKYPADATRVAEATAAQRQAFAPATSLWVSANAGTGKTTVLTQRVLALLLANPTLEPRQILALTFTKVAAGEMAERLPRLVAQWAAKPEATLQADVPHLLGLPYHPGTAARLAEVAHQMRQSPPTLTTIHGFAQQVLAALPAAAGLPEGFGLLDESGQRSLLQQVQQQLLVAPPEHLLPYLQTLLAELGDEAVQELPMMLVNNWWRLEDILGPHGLAEGVKQVMARLDEALALPPPAVLYAPQRPTPEQVAALVAMGVAVPATQEDWEALLLTKTGTARKRLFVKEQRARVPEAAVEDLLRAAQQLEAIFKARKAAVGRHLTEALLVWAAQVQGLYKAAKQARGMVDFNDLLVRLEAVLAQPEESAAAWLWHRLDTRYRHLLVDEAQDNNAAQSRIVQRLAQNLLAGDVGEGARTVLAVGDVKQSIYRFQGAQPQWFIALRGLLEAWASPAQTVQLGYTFRNSPAILEVVNAVFAPEEWSAQVQGETAPWPTHTSVFAQRPARVELWPLEKAQPGDRLEGEEGQESLPAEEEDEPAEGAEEGAEEAAGAVARWAMAEERAAEVPTSAKMRSLQRVATWLAAQVAAGPEMPSTGRPLGWGDVLVVVQTNATARLLAAVFRRQGIPVAAGVGEAPIEVQDMVALLRVLYNSADTLAMAQVLKGLCGWGDGQVLVLAQRAKGQNISWAEALAQAEYAAEPRGLAAFMASLPVPCPVPMVVQRAVAWWGLALAPFAPLMGWAESAEASPVPHWGPLGTLVARIETEGAPMAAALAEGAEGAEGHAGVRILTTHRAKGLEAPLVILPETMRPMMESREKLLWGKDVVLYKKEKGTSTLEDALRAAEAEACRADALRGLYVALTRAIDWLVIAGWEDARKGPRKKKPVPKA